VGTLRHSTFVEHLPSIVAQGLVPEGGSASVLRAHDKGWVSFEKNPPSDWLVTHLPELKPRKGTPIPLDFDEDLVNALGLEIIVKPPIELSVYFADPAEVDRHVGAYVKVKGMVPLSCLTPDSKQRLRTMGYEII
jgi:hypothetical protein